MSSLVWLKNWGSFFAHDTVGRLYLHMTLMYGWVIIVPRFLAGLYIHMILSWWYLSVWYFSAGLYLSTILLALLNLYIILLAGLYLSVLDIFGGVILAHYTFDGFVTYIITCTAIMIIFFADYRSGSCLFSIFNNSSVGLS